MSALKVLERVLIECTGRPALLEQDAVALLLGRSLGDGGLCGGKSALGGSHPVPVIDVAELGELLPLRDNGADVDITCDEAAAHFKSHRAVVARLNETGAFGHDPKLMGRNDNDPSRSHGSGRGVLILTTRKVHAGDARAEERN